MKAAISFAIHESDFAQQKKQLEKIPLKMISRVFKMGEIKLGNSIAFRYFSATRV